MFIVTLSRKQIYRRIGFLMTLALLAFLTSTAGQTARLTSAEVDADRPLTRAPVEENRVALTFDVTWGDQELGKILGILEGQGLKGTFFVGGTFLALYPDAVRQIQKAGHEVGTLGQRIDNLSVLNEQEITQTLLDSQSSLSKILGQRVRYFRPPQGPATPSVVSAARAAELVTVTSSLDSEDHRGRSAAQITRRVVRGARKGDIILLSASDWSPETSKALPAILKGLKEKGFAVGRISDLMIGSDQRAQ